MSNLALITENIDKSETQPSLYAQYLTERTEDHILEDKFGFATYRFLNENQVYIIDLYVVPNFRNRNIAANYADQICKIAKETHPCMNTLIGTVNPSAKGATESVKVLLAYGMVVDSSSNNVIVFRKEI